MLFFDCCCEAGLLLLDGPPCCLSCCPDLFPTMCLCCCLCLPTRDCCPGQGSSRAALAQGSPFLLSVIVQTADSVAGCTPGRVASCSVWASRSGCLGRGWSWRIFLSRRPGCSWMAPGCLGRGWRWRSCLSRRPSCRWLASDSVGPSGNTARLPWTGGRLSHQSVLPAAAAQALPDAPDCPPGQPGCHRCAHNASKVHRACLGYGSWEPACKNSCLRTEHNSLWCQTACFLKT